MPGKLVSLFLVSLLLGLQATAATAATDAPAATPAPAAAAKEDNIPELERCLAEGDRLLKAGKPVEAIRTWRSIWNITATTFEGVGRKLDTYERYVDAYETMGPEGLQVAADYLDPIAKRYIEELQPPRFLRLGDILWKLNRKTEAAAAYQRVLALQPAHQEAARLKERIGIAAVSPNDASGVTGTRVSPPRAVPADCIDPPAARTYPLGAGKMLCVAYNEFVEEPGYWSSRETLGGEANLTVTIEGAPPAPKTNDPLPITVYLKEGSTWRRVLKSHGFAFRFLPDPGHELPKLEITWDSPRDPSEEMRPIIGETHTLTTVFTWKGKGYGDAALPAARNLNTKALAKLGKGDPGGALRQWEAALKLALIPKVALPADPEILNNYGFALIKKDHQKAEAFLSYALLVDPARWQAHLNLGDLYWDQGHFDKALKSYRAVLALNPSYRRAALLQGRILEKEKAIAGLKEEAPGEMTTKGHDHTQCEEVTFPTAAEYARKVGLDPVKIAAALELTVREIDDGDPFVTSIFVSDRYRSSCFSSRLRVMETLAFTTEKGRFIAVLYWGAAPKGDVSQWRLAILNKDYAVQKVMPIYEGKEEAQDLQVASTNLLVDSGRIVATVIGSERAAPTVTRQLVAQVAANGGFEVVSSRLVEDYEEEGDAEGAPFEADKSATGVLFESYPRVTVDFKISDQLSDQDFYEPHHGYKMDLNGDGTDDYILESPADLCGTGGCPYLVVDGKTAKEIGDFVGGQLIVSREKVNKYAVIKRLVYSGPEEAEIETYTYVKGKYRLKGSKRYTGKALDSQLAELQKMGRSR